MDTSHIFRPIIGQTPGQPDPTSGDAADLARLDEDRWKHGAIIDVHAEALEIERRRQVLAWLEHRGVGRTPTPGTVARGVELDHAEAIRGNHRPAAVVAPQLVGTPGRQFCRKGQHSCTPAFTMVFPDGQRLHWCADHVFFASAYRASAVEIIDHRGDENGFFGSPDRDPCADGCSDPAAHAEGGHDV